ncbi:MAG: hypothetical protein HOW73_44005 [Polyangiaceae bacterium]|nr:hypothetical protein [Polyangiaceae bacterium]
MRIEWVEDTFGRVVWVVLLACIVGFLLIFTPIIPLVVVNLLVIVGFFLAPTMMGTFFGREHLQLLGGFIEYGHRCRTARKARLPAERVRQVYCAYWTEETVLSDSVMVIHRYALRARLTDGTEEELCRVSAPREALFLQHALAKALPASNVTGAAVYRQAASKRNIQRGV